MPVMEKLRRFVAQDPVVAVCSSSSQFRASINDHAAVRPMLDSLEGRKHVPERQPSISDVLAGMTGKQQG